MTKYFTYSLLQYHQSPVLQEAVNIGIVFHFPEFSRGEPALFFVYGNSQRLKPIYPDFDAGLFQALLKTIEKKVKKAANLFAEQNLAAGLKSFLDSTILLEDESSFQFSAPVTVSNSYKSSQEAVKAFSLLLLPGINIEKPKLTRITEAFIIKKYRNYLKEAGEKAEEKIIQKPSLKILDSTIKFELAWQNGTLNYVRPLSFDLKDASEIENKGFLNSGQLNFITQHTDTDNIRFDFIIAPPADKKLYKNFENAIRIIDEAPAPHKLIFDSELKKYSEETIDSLLL
jgi:hypothetical protein